MTYHVSSGMLNPTHSLAVFHLYCTSSYASTILAVVILTVCLSHVCFVTKPSNALWIFWYHTRRQSL